MGNKEGDERTMQIEAGAVEIGADTPTEEAPVDIQAHIGSKLKALYAEIVNQPIPEKLLELVRKLEAKGNGA